MTTCSITGCDRPHYGRGWCRAHYRRWYKTGDVRADEPLGRYSDAANLRTSERMKGVSRGPMGEAQRAAISAAKRGRSNGINGRPVSLETRSKIAAANSGDGNGQWRGDKAGYVAVHERARKTLPKVCAFCGATESLECALKADAVGPIKTQDMPIAGVVRTLRFSTRPDDYMRLCVPCHRKYDLAK